MGRWQPGTEMRLQQVALELFGENGYEATTVAEIARRAEVTERTFYRYFTDKREVLFDGQELLRAAILAGVANAPAAGSPMDLAAAALESAAEFFPDERRGWSRARQAIIESDPALQERELLKLASLAADLGRALQDRGVPQPEAGLAADSAISVFRIAFGRWIAADEPRTMGEIQRDLLATLQRLAVEPRT